MKSIVAPVGGVRHFLIYLNEDVEIEESDKDWLGTVDVPRGNFQIHKRSFLLSQGSYITGHLDPTNPEFQLIVECHESQWNGLTSLLLSIGSIIGIGGTVVDGLGVYSIIGTVITLGSLIIPLVGGNLLKKEFDAYLEKYEQHVALNLKDAAYRRKRWGKK